MITIILIAMVMFFLALPKQKNDRILSWGNRRWKNSTARYLINKFRSTKEEDKTEE